MRTLKYRTRRCPQKQRKKLTLTPTVEALEPRLVLSAAGFGFEGAGERLDLHARDHGIHDPIRSAFAEEHHDERDSLRLEISDRHTDRNNANLKRLELRSPKPGRDGHARGIRPREPASENVFELGQRESHFDEESAESHDYLENGKTEPTSPTYRFEDFASNESIDAFFESNLFSAPTIQSTATVFIPLTPTSSPARGSDSLRFEPPQPRSVSNDSVSPLRDSASTLPVSVPLSSPASSRTPPIISTVESPIVHFEPTSVDSDAVLVHPASESTRSTEPGGETFVSLANNDLARGWNLDGESFEIAFETSSPLTDSVWPSTANEEGVDSLIASTDDRSERLSEESLWAVVSEGGFIEIDTESGGSSREQFELLEDAKDLPSSRLLSSRTIRDAFWIDFSDTRLELILDSTAYEELAEDWALGDAADADEEAWLLDEGGMIVLTSSPFTEQSVEVAVDEGDEYSSSSQPSAVEIDIPMDAGIGVFQAIEVAEAPVEQQDSVDATGDTPAPVECEASAADAGLPSAEQAPQNSDSGQSEPSRVASVPLLLTIFAFLTRSREKQNKVAGRQRKA